MRLNIFNYTDNEIFGEPYDLGALWLENGDTNPFKIYGEKNSKFKMYKERGEEMYAVYNGNKRTSQEDELWSLYDNTEAAIAKTRKDIAPIEVVPNQDQRWFNTVHTIIGPWQMGKDFSDFSCKDFNFDYEVPQKDMNAVHVWRSKNPVNELVYGYGGVKLLPTKLTLDMDCASTDMTTSISNRFRPMEQISNTSLFNSTPFNTWKSAFRECVKLSSKVIDRQDNKETEARLNVWCNNSNDSIAIAGAKAGRQYGEANKNNKEALAKINDFDWLKEQYNDNPI